MDKLFLLKPSFANPALPGRLFYCWHCALLEGLLAMYPELNSKIQVSRVDWERPRGPVIAEVGPENQSLPLIVLREGEASRHETGRWKNRSFIADKDAILKYLSEEYGIAESHP
jgi:hypothetical protein